MWYAPAHLFVVFVFYGIASTGLSYAISLLVSSQLGAFALAAGTQAILLLVYFLGSVLLPYMPSYVTDFQKLFCSCCVQLGRRFGFKSQHVPIHAWTCNPFRKFAKSIIA